jgi:hypothetical protein
MRRLLVIFVAASLILAPYAPFAKAKSSSSKPPIEQPLVSEGEFAVELANALNLTSSHDGAAAENSLASVNIAPRNGWISNYPMTPDIVAEVRESTARSASAGSLNMSEADAVGAVDGVSIAMNLPVKAAGNQYSYESGSGSGPGSEYQSGSSYEYQPGSAPPPPGAYEYEDPGAVDEYYDEYGPPVVTYYPPPWDYSYLYDWVPYPFWWGGFGFGGFYVLGDFHRHYHHHWISNHVAAANGTVTRVNAVARATAGTGAAGASTLAGTSGSTPGSRLNSANAQAGARSILNRQTGSTAVGAAGSSATSRNLTSTGASPNMGNTGGTVRSPVAVTRDMDRAASGGSVGTMSRGAVPVSPSYSGRTFSSVGSARSFSGGGFSGFHGGGGFGGGGFHGGGGHGGGGHR